MSSKEDVKWKLQVIFVYYTSYADRNNYKLLKQQNYRRFLIDSETVKTQSSLVHYDIAFQKITHSAIIFKDFLKLIPDIAQIVFKNTNRSKAFNQYIHKHIQPLFMQIVQKSQLGQDINLALTCKIDKEIQKKLAKLIVTEKAYNQYITNSMNGKDILQVFQCFANFLKDFQICPQLVSKSLVYIVYLSLIKDKSMSQVFSLQDFVKSMIIISEVSSRKLSTSQLSNNMKMIKLLERMEISAGFDKVSKKIMYQTAISPSFLKSFIQNGMQQEYMEKSANRIYSGTSRHRHGDSADFSGKKQYRKQQLKQQNLQAVQNLISQQNQSLSQEFKQIKLAFEQLCQIGQVANSKTLKSIKIKKLFQRIGLVSLVGQAWLDIQVVNLQRSSQSGKIEFPQFLQLLSLTSKKIGAAFEQIIKLVLTDQQLTHKLMQQSSKQKQYTVQQQKLLKQIIQSCQKQAQKIYRKYTSDNPLMSFQQFTKMMYDFQIFPTIISKNRLYQLFSTLNDVREENSPSGKKLKKSKDVEMFLKDDKKIDFSGFLMGLIQVAQEICDQSLEVGQKIIILLEKINQSAGYKKICNVSLVQNLRKKFAGYYVKNFHKEKQPAEDFDELLNSFT